MKNTVPRAGIEPASLTFQASVLPLHNVGSLMSPQYSHLPVYAVPFLRGQRGLLQYYSSTWAIIVILYWQISIDTE